MSRPQLIKENQQGIKTSLQTSSNANESLRVIGNYRIEKSIGEGTFAKVKVGKHILTEEKVAVKILEKEKIKDKKTLDRITRELSFLKKLNHPNIIQLYEILETNKFLFIIMEYPRHGELFEHIVKKRRLNEQEASVFFAQIIKGIEYLHSKRIAHRDLKPENLIIDDNRLLKIIDFGLSNSYKDLLQTPCGSPCYAAPEMIQGKKYKGLNIDIWSTGIILYAMVCGYLPFEDDNNTVLYKKILECKLEFPFKLNNSCMDMIKRILTTSPENRIKLDEIKKHSFFLMGEKLIKKEMVYAEKNDNVERKVFERMERMGFNIGEVIKNIDDQEYNNITSTYFLLYKKISKDLGFDKKEDEILYASTEPSVSKNRLLNDEKNKKKELKLGMHKNHHTTLVEYKNPQITTFKENIKIDSLEPKVREKKQILSELKTPTSKLKMKLLEFNLKNSKNNVNNYFFNIMDKTRNIKFKDKYININDLKLKEVDFKTESNYINIFGRPSKPSINYLTKEKLIAGKKAINKTDAQKTIYLGDSINLLSSYEKVFPSTTKNELYEKRGFVGKINNRMDSFNFTSRNFFERSKKKNIISNSVEKNSSFSVFKDLSNKINKAYSDKKNTFEKIFNVSSKQFLKKYI